MVKRRDSPDKQAAIRQDSPDEKAVIRWVFALHLFNRSQFKIIRMSLVINIIFSALFSKATKLQYSTVGIS